MGSVQAGGPCLRSHAGERVEPQTAVHAGMQKHPSDVAPWSMWRSSLCVEQGCELRHGSNTYPAGDLEQGCLLLCPPSEPNHVP